MPDFVEIFVCELSWDWYDGARVVEVFGLGWVSVFFCVFFFMCWREAGFKFCESD